MIDLDSPLTTVVGDKAAKRKRIAEGLGLHTVGDLLRHFPRRYVKAGELTDVADLEPGEMLTVVGEIVESDLNTYQDRRTHRPAYRLDTVAGDRRPEAADVVLRQERAHRAVERRPSVGGPARRLRRVRSAPSATSGSSPTRGWSCSASRPARRARTAASSTRFGALYPLYPPDQGRGLLGHPARGELRAQRASTTCPSCCPPRSAPSYDLLDARTALDLHPRARRLRAGAGRPAALPVRGGAGHPGGPGPAAGVPARARRPGPHGRRRAARGLRRAAAVRR